MPCDDIRDSVLDDVTYSHDDVTGLSLQLDDSLAPSLGGGWRCQRHARRAGHTSV